MRRNIGTFDLKDRKIIMDIDNMAYISVAKAAFEEKMIEEKHSKVMSALNYVASLAPKVDEEQLNSIYLVVTENCNMSCKFCCMRADKHTKEKEETILTCDDVMKMLPALQYYKPRKIMITGGEPVLNGELFSIVKILREKTDAVLTLQSNGTLLKEEHFKQLHNYIHEINMSTAHYTNLEHVIEIIELCKKYNILLTLTYTYEDSIERVYKLIDAAVEYETDLMFNFISMTGSAYDNDLPMMTAKEYLSVQQQIVNYILEHNYEDSKVAKSYFSTLKMRKSCSALGKMLAVYPSGDCYICHSIREEEFRIGNIIKDDFTKVLEKHKNICQKDSIKKLFHVEHKEDCKNCDIRYFCSGFCGATMYNQAYSSDECIILRFGITYALCDYDRKASNRENLQKYYQECSKLLEAL